MTRESTKSARVARKPLNQRGPQAIAGDKDPSYVYRFVNDTGSRIQNFKAAGYEFVTGDDLIVGDNRVSDATDLGSAKRVISDDGTTSYLMRIKKEWFEEDQANKAAALKEQEAAMTKEASTGMYGKLNIS